MIVGGYLTPLPLTQKKKGQGGAVMQVHPAGRYPSCSAHGAMNRVTDKADWWRCLTCNIGVAWHREAQEGGQEAQDR